MGSAQTDNLDKYKSYIQRRRVGSDESDTNAHTLITEPMEGKAENSEESYSSFGEININNIDEFFSRNTEKKSAETSFGNYNRTDDIGLGHNTEKVSPLKDILKGDRAGCWQEKSYSSDKQTERSSSADLYSRLYGQTRKRDLSSKYTNTYHKSSRRSAEIEDNRTTLLAIKVIKQSLACFAILGLIVLLQQISSMSGVLEFFKKHVVDTHIDHEAVFAGVENIVKECSRFLGGSP